MVHVRAVAIGLLLFGAGAARALPEDVEGPDGLVDDPGGWSVAAPDAAFSERAEAAARYSRKRGGLALLIVKEDAIAFEEAENGFDLRRAHHLWSGTKTFTCALAAAAEVDGRFTLGTEIGAVLPLDARRASLTVRDLLSLTSGLSESPLLTTDFLRAKPQIADKEAWTLREITAVHDPGTRFRYAASAFAMFSAFARAALGEDPIEYLTRRVLEPIGYRSGGWVKDAAGHGWFSFGAYTSARSWARFGMLLRDDGLFRGQQVLPGGLLSRCFEGSAAMPAYGLGIWLNREATQLWLPPALQGRFASKGPILLPGGPADLMAAAGYNDNRLYVIPSEGLVIVRFGKGDPSFEDDKLLGLLLPR